MKSLPENPNLDFLKKEARQLRALHRQRHPSSYTRIQHYDTSFSGKSARETFNAKFSILDAQRVVAREYGFSSWTKLKRFIESMKRKFNKSLHDILIDMRNRDKAMRANLLAADSLYDGYHPDMELIHNENANQLKQIIEIHGWPIAALVGLDGSRAAWMIVQHAIGQPDFQKSCLQLLTDAAEKGHVPSRQVALLNDAILYQQQQPQTYGVVGDWNEKGELTYGEIMDASNVNRRRALVGLGPIEEELVAHRLEVSGEGGRPPKDLREFEENRKKWAKKVGWI